MNGPRCGCGNRGCIEVYASATAVVRRMREAGGRPVSAENIYGAAGRGDRLSRKIVEETGFYLGCAITNIINALNPEMIVISGGMAKAGKPLLDKIKETVKERALKESRRGLKIVLGKLGEDAGIIGAVKFLGI
jgi:glucokinase